MPAIVRGGGGGKSTKDATAVPGDVRSGKTFYGADGKQTGIWTPKVTDYTGDATALPEDVRKGKVFYNNQGRQEGIEEGFRYETLLIKYPKGVSHPDNFVDNGSSIDYKTGNTDRVIFNKEDFSSKDSVNPPLFQELHIPIVGSVIKVKAYNSQLIYSPTYRNIYIISSNHKRNFNFRIYSRSSSADEGISVTTNNGYITGISFYHRYSYTGNYTQDLSYDITIEYLKE